MDVTFEYELRKVILQAGMKMQILLRKCTVKPNILVLSLVLFLRGFLQQALHSILVLLLKLLMSFDDILNSIFDTLRLVLNPLKRIRMLVHYTDDLRDLNE